MTPSRPARACRDGAVVLAVVVACRVPAIERAFVAALAAAGDPARRRAAAAPSRRGAPPVDGATLSPAAVAAPSAALASAPARDPAQAAVARGRGRSPVAFAAAAGPPAEADRHLVTAALALDAPAAVDPAAGSLATAAYGRLAAGDRRGAVRLFDAALVLGDPRAAVRRRQRDALTRRWSGSAYSIVRAGGDPALAVTPVLGGGQSGGGIAFTPDPLSPRPVAVTARGSIAHADAGRSAFAAVGVQWRPLAGVTLAAERLVAVGRAGPNDWTVRLAGGTERTVGRWLASAYGEGGIVGHAAYAALQGRAAGVVHLAGIEVDPGAGVWSSVQHDRATVDRVEVGPGVVARAGRFTAEVDYRFRVAGNAAPGSGPVLTLSAGF